MAHKSVGFDYGAVPSGIGVGSRFFSEKLQDSGLYCGFCSMPLWLGLMALGYSPDSFS